MWTLVLKTKKYYYWKHEDGYYNCTIFDQPPAYGTTGYYNLMALRNLKNDAK